MVLVLIPHYSGIIGSKVQTQFSCVNNEGWFVGMHKNNDSTDWFSTPLTVHSVPEKENMVLTIIRMC